MLPTYAQTVSKCAHTRKCPARLETTELPSLSTVCAGTKQGTHHHAYQVLKNYHVLSANHKPTHAYGHRRTDAQKTARNNVATHNATT